MAADGHLIFDTKIDQSGFDKGMTALKKAFGALVAAFSVKQLFDFGKSAVGIASDLQEVQNVVDTAFGEMSYKMESFAETAIEQFGISELAAKRTGSTFASMAAAIGLAQDAASDMALSLTGLSADMASFYNVSQEEASTALASVFTGETETLKRYGIVMTEVNLQAFALSQGINKTYREMTQAEKTQLRYAYVMQQTALAHGDFAKTSGSWANQTRILSEQFRELSGIIGSAIMQSILPHIRTLNEALASIIGYAQSAYNALAKCFGWEPIAAGAGSAAVSISAATDAQNALTDAVEGTAKAQENALAGFDKIEKLSSTSSDASGNTDTAAAITVPTVYTANTEQAQTEMEALGSDFMSFIRDSFADIDLSPLQESLSGLWETLQPFAGTIGEGLEWFWGNVLVPLAAWTIEEAVPTFLDTLGDALEGARDIWDTAAPVLKEELWDEFLKPIADWTADATIKLLEDLGDALKDLGDSMDEKDVRIMVGAAKAIGGIFVAIKGYGLASGAIAAISGVVGKIAAALPGIIAMLTAPLTLSLGTVFGAITAAFVGWEIGSTIYDIVGDKIDAVLWPFFEAWEIGIGVIVDAFDAAGEAIGAAWEFMYGYGVYFYDWIRGVPQGIMSAFQNIASWFKKKFQTAYSNVKSAFGSIGTWFSSRWTDVKNAFGSAGSWFKEKFDSAYSSVKNAFSGVGTFFSELWTSITSPFTDIAGWFRDKFSGAWEAVMDVFTGDGLSDMLDGIGSTFTDMVNTIIDALNTVIAAPFNAINDALSTVRGFSIMGSTPFSGIPTISVPEIPKLATGTVVPANYGEFLAVLGDNKREAEIVSPLSTMEQAVERVLRRRQDGGGDIHIMLTLDGKTVYKTIVKRNDESIRMTGKNPLAPTKGVMA